jgi:hypothetical protein
MPASLAPYCPPARAQTEAVVDLLALADRGIAQAMPTTGAFARVRLAGWSVHYHFEGLLELVGCGSRAVLPSMAAPTAAASRCFACFTSLGKT